MVVWEEFKENTYDKNTNTKYIIYSNIYNDEIAQKKMF